MQNKNIFKKCLIIKVIIHNSNDRVIQLENLIEHN